MPNKSNLRNARQKIAELKNKYCKSILDSDSSSSKMMYHDFSSQHTNNDPLITYSNISHIKINQNNQTKFPNLPAKTLKKESDSIIELPVESEIFNTIQPPEQKHLISSYSYDDSIQSKSSEYQSLSRIPDQSNMSIQHSEESNSRHNLGIKNVINNNYLIEKNINKEMSVDFKHSSNDDNNSHMAKNDNNQQSEVYTSTSSIDNSNELNIYSPTYTSKSKSQESKRNENNDNTIPAAILKTRSTSLPNIETFTNSSNMKFTYGSNQPKVHVRKKEILLNKSKKKQNRYKLHITDDFKVKSPLPHWALKSTKSRSTGQETNKLASGGCCDEIIRGLLKNQVQIIRHLMKSNHQMYILYCEAVKDISKKMGLL